MKNLPLSNLQSFLLDLESHNSLDWMHAHKAAYTDARTAFEALLSALIARIGRFDPAVLDLDPHALVGRLNRDTRFSKDKSPYRAAFRAHLSKGGNAPIPVGYFLQLDGRGCMLGGGLFASQLPEATARIRVALAQRAEEAEAILDGLRAAGLPVQGAALKRVPAGYPADHSLADLLRHKSWYLETTLPFPPEQDLPNWLDAAASRFRAMKPWNDFLNRALDDR
jgi:uncharacterized protein (TIGR02453 family)